MQKTIGILGGMTPESTTTYYEHITRSYIKRYGNYGFPAIVIYSVSFQQFEDWMVAEQWDSIADELSNGISALHKAGAEFGVIATNTMHNVFSQVEKRSPIPLLSIIDATAYEIKKRGIRKVGLLGTRFTMQKSFYKDGLGKHGIETLVPNEKDMEIVHTIIFRELGSGIFSPASREKYRVIVQELSRLGAEGVVLGCTEIPLLIQEKDCGVPLFDTATLHAEAALKYSIGK